MKCVLIYENELKKKIQDVYYVFHETDSRRINEPKKKKRWVKAP